jgi:protein-disulfide isomerase
VAVHFELFTSSFCGACAQTRSVLETATSVIPHSHLTEHDVAFEPDLAETAGIVSTPTVIVRDAEGREVVRATGVPTMDQVLRAAVLAVNSPE